MEEPAQRQSKVGAADACKDTDAIEIRAFLKQIHLVSWSWLDNVILVRGKQLQELVVFPLGNTVLLQYIARVLKIDLPLFFADR